MNTMTSSPNDSTQANAFAEIVGGFADGVTNNFSQLIEAQPEDQLKTVAPLYSARP